MHFSLPGYDINRNDRTWITKGGVAFLYKSELILIKLYYNNDFKIITNNEALATKLELSNKMTLTWPLSIVQMEDQTAICSGRLPHFRLK